MTQAINTSYCLSPQQRRLWLLGQGSEFRAQALLLLEGPLEAARLREAAALVVRRHEIFRTAFVRLPGFKALVQTVCDVADPSWDVTDLRGCSPEEHHLLIERRAKAERLRTLDLERAPLVSFSLLILTENTHVLTVTLPALCADEQTLDNLAADLGRCYEALSAGAETDEEVVQYAQFSEWQHELLASEEGDEAREFWRVRAAAAFDPPPLPLESRPGEPAAYAPESLTLEVPTRLAAQATSAALARGTTEEVFLLACWQTLIWRLTGRAEVAMHVLCPGRVYEEMAGAMGLYARWPFVVTSFEEDYQFAEVIGQVDDALAVVHEWQEYYSWEQLEEDAAEQADGGKSASRAASPAFGFAWERAEGGRRFAGVTFTLKQKHALTERFKLRLGCCADGGALALTFQYDPAFYTAQAVALLADYFLTLLRAFVTDARERVGRPDLLSERERHRLLVEWNDTRRDFPAARCVPELFEEQAARTPDALAVAARDESLTFGQLEERANRLANYLRGRGVGPDVPVVLLTERSAEMIVGLLGILKAGGAYVPLDPTYPTGRLSFMLEDTGVPLVLTQSRLREALAPEDARVICLDTQWPEIAAESAQPPRPALDPENLAYVIYTSGSTGRPKGVGVRHRSVVNLATALREGVYEGLEGPLRVSVNASVSFDSSVKQIVQLLDGHSLQVVPEEVRPDGEALLAYVREHGIDVLDCPPSQLRLLLDAGLFSPASRAPRLVLVGGEAITADLWSLLAGQDDIKFYNVYGPTECTVDATVCRVSREAARPNIGRPIANATAYVLDGRMRPAPLGVTGELYLGGEGVARGYLNRPALTAERFVPDPFGAEPGTRLYRTGDLVRFGVGGEIEYFGREDGQVKVRGFRVELGEIEAALRAHEGVRNAVVVRREDESGAGARLVGYVVGCVGDLSVGDLRSHLRGRLPEYMTPSELLVLDELPLTPNGKVDRRALLSCDAWAAPQRHAYVAPRTPVEEALAGVWAEVLKVERVDVGANFFDLGGHSLLAMQVVSRIRSKFRMEIPLRRIFERPTIEGLADSIEKSGAGIAAHEPPAIPRAPRDSALPLSFAQQRLWFLDQLDPDSAAYNLPVALRLTGRADPWALEQSFNELVRRHEVLRTTFVGSEGRPVQVVAPTLTVTLPLSDLSAWPAAEREAEVRRLVAEEARRAFDLARGPLMRVRLLRLAEEEHVLLLTMHHIITDGWSTGILIREMSALYRAFSAGQPSPLAELNIQYADYAAWQREWLQGETLERQLAYWRERLAGASSLIELLPDYARPPRQTFQGGREWLRLSPTLTNALQEISRREGATMYMTLLAGFQLLLHRLTGQEDITVGSPIAGRSQAEIENLIGFFVNTLVLRTDLSGEPSFRQLIRRVREVTLGAYEHQHVPFELLVEELRPERSLSHTPLFQVFFNMHNFPDRESGLKLSGLEIELLTSAEFGSKFDLTLYAAERAGGVHLNLVYNSDLFAPARAAEMMRQLESLLLQAVRRPDEKVSSLTLLTGDAVALLPAPAAAPVVPADEEVVHAPFSRQARRVPERVAVADAHDEWTYAELDARSNQLANCLRAGGIAQQEVVAIYGHRSASLVWALLGVLKAGAAFVVLDPAYPAARLIEHLRLASPRGWLQLEAAGELPGELEEFVACLPPGRRLRLPRRVAAGQLAALAHHSTATPDLTVAASGLAYVAFTSGSTGQPKGIAGGHRPLSHFLRWHTQRFGLLETDRFSMLSGLAHDPLLRDIFTPLWLGATLSIPEREQLLGPGELARWMRRERISVAHLTPALGQLLRGTDDSARATDSGEQNLPSLRYLFFGGDRLTDADVEKLRALAPNATCVNFYGATETPQAVGYYVVPAHGEEEAQPGAVASVKRRRKSLPLGRGRADVQLIILNRGGQLCGIGEAGEVHVRTPHLAFGYLDDEALTSRRFITNPFTGLEGDRLYKTGDLGRYLPDGNVEFLGRLDEQVKVRGYRVEPGDVQAALESHPSVREAAVVVGKDARGIDRLMSYVVARDGQLQLVSELRRFLRGKLPEYMLPSEYVLLESLPLTPNGKLDRRALPPPPSERKDAASPAAQLTPTETALASIWADVLGLEPVSAADNFFELGGHSLRATQVISRVREAFHVNVPLGDLFTSPTVGAFAEKIEEAILAQSTPDYLDAMLAALEEIDDEA